MTRIAAAPGRTGRSRTGWSRGGFRSAERLDGERRSPRGEAQVAAPLTQIRLGQVGVEAAQDVALGAGGEAGVLTAQDVLSVED